MFWPLLAYGAATLVSSIFSVDPRVSFIDSKQLVLFAIVPIAYRLLRGPADAEGGRRHDHASGVERGLRHRPVRHLRFDNLGQRVQGTLGHYMTYSGLIMLVACAAARASCSRAGSRSGRR